MHELETVEKSAYELLPARNDHSFQKMRLNPTHLESRDKFRELLLLAELDIR